MAERALASSALREQERLQIERDVQEFLARGGKIECIQPPVRHDKERVWRPSHLDSFDGL